MKIIIIGGVAGGASAAARLRRLNEQAEIILLERGDYISYANCGLPYYIGDRITSERALTLQTPESFRQRFRIDVRTGNEALSIDPERKIVTIRKSAEEASYQESYDKLILSPGAEPLCPDWEGMEDPRIFTLRNIPDTLKIKALAAGGQVKTAVVAGGGYIGVEMAENLAQLGISVTIAELADHLIAPLDFDMACEVHHYLRSKGIGIRLKTGVRRFVPGKHGIQVILDEGALSADMVILAIGVKPDTILAQEAGLACNPKGSILVNEHMQTSDRDIYAVGDAIEVLHLVTGKPAYIPLAGPANKQGRIAADHISGMDSSYSGTQGSAILKLFDMTVASTGINEALAAANDLDYDKAYAFSASHAVYYPGASNMCIKLLFGKGKGQLLGAQIVGYEGVDKRCDVIATAIRAKMTVFDLTELELCYAPPFSSAKDPVNMAGFIAENILTDKVRQYYWQEVDALTDRGGIVQLDVRTPDEYGRGHIKDAVSIPLDSLRDNLHKLNKEKDYYVNCQSGLRSYLACRILMQNGFACYNLAGGYRLYQSVTGELALEEAAALPCGLRVAELS